MKCTNCKSNFELEYTFCPNCGQELRNLEVEVENKISSSFQVKESSLDKSKLVKPIGLRLLLIIIWALVITNNYYYIDPLEDYLKSSSELIDGAKGRILITASRSEVFISELFSSSMVPIIGFIMLIDLISFLICKIRLRRQKPFPSLVHVENCVSKSLSSTQNYFYLPVIVILILVFVSQL